MMNSKITNKLIYYFSFAILFYSIIVGLIFTGLIMKQSKDVKIKELYEKGKVISNFIVDIEEKQNNKNGMMQQRNKMGDLDPYRKVINDIATIDLWIYDIESNTISVGTGKKPVKLERFPENIKENIEESVGNEYISTKAFSNIIEENTLSVLVPIKEDDEVLGTVIVHSSMKYTNDTIFAGIKILLICIGVSLLLIPFVTIYLSKRFTLPLRKINKSALHISEGKFDVKTEVLQDDEIGDLAKTVDEMAEKLLNAKEESKRYEEMRENFLYSVSHELKTPVTVIRSYVEAINDGIIDDEKQIEEFLLQIQKESIYMQKLINDLLDLAKLQNIDFKIECEYFNILDVTNDVLRTMINIAKNKNHKIVYNNNINNTEVFGDYSRVRQVIIILLDNAIKYSNDGEDIFLNLLHENNKISLEVKNIGREISKKDLPYIFDRYYQISNSNTTGAGLGLAITKEITRRLNIDVKVSSENGKTSFKLIFNNCIIK